MTRSFLPSARFKARLKGGESLACHWLQLGAPALAELAGEAGPDALVIDMQHGLWDRAGLEAAVGAAGEASAVLVRTADQSASAIGAALDAGAAGVIAPLVNTAAEARAVVAAAHFPPRGVRSAGAARTLIDFATYRRAAQTDLVAAVMIETAEAVEAAGAIAGTPGVDLIFIGPGDLAISLGPGAGEAAFETALARVLAAGREAGVPVGVFTPNVEQALERAAQGFQFTVFVSDVELNRGHARAQWKRFAAGRR